MRVLRLHNAGLLLGLVFALTGCNVQIGIAQPQATVISVTSNDPMTQRFADTIAVGVKLNSGISLQRIGTGITIGGAPGSGDDIYLMILNHSSEPVIFSDQSFGLRAFQFDVNTNNWYQQQFLFRSVPEQKTIPPKVERYDGAVDNALDLGSRPFGSADHGQFRLYVEGTGTVTAQKYGAYLDVTLNQ